LCLFAGVFGLVRWWGHLACTGRCHQCWGCVFCGWISHRCFLRCVQGACFQR